MKLFLDKRKIALVFAILINCRKKPGKKPHLFFRHWCRCSICNTTAIMVSSLRTLSALHILLYVYINRMSHFLLASSESCSTMRLPSGKCCVFPFEYNGRQYNDCTVEDAAWRPWCATTSNFSRDGEWEYCDCKRCFCCYF